MEVPTVLSLASLQQQIPVQIVDNPVPLGRGDHGGLQGFPLRRGSQRTVEEIFDIPAGLGLQEFLPDPGVAASSAVSRYEAFHGRGRFRTFPRFQKKCEVRLESESEGARELEPSACEGRGGDALQGSVPGQSSAALHGGLQGVLPGQSSTWGEAQTQYATLTGTSSKEAASKAKRAALRILCIGCILTPLGRSSCSSSMLANRMPETCSGAARTFTVESLPFL